MNCDCINQIDEQLSEQNLALDRLYLLGGGIGMTLYVGTHFKDEEKKKRGDKTTKLIVSFCPFCGKSAEKEQEIEQ